MGITAAVKALGRKAFATTVLGTVGLASAANKFGSPEALREE